MPFQNFYRAQPNTAQNSFVLLSVLLRTDQIGGPLRFGRTTSTPHLQSYIVNCCELECLVSVVDWSGRSSRCGAGTATNVHALIRQD